MSVLDRLAKAREVDNCLAENVTELVMEFVGEEFMAGQELLDKVDSELQKAIDDTYIYKCLGF